jgi:hypothetical protein
LIGIAACAAVVLVAMLLTSEPEPVAAPKIVVPEGQESELAVPRPPASSVSVLPPAQPPDTSTTTTTATPPVASSPRPATPPPAAKPASPKPPSQPAGVDFQAENATIINGSIESNHAGFTGSGFVDYRNEVGSAIEWTVTALETTGVDVVFRYANGTSEARPMTITVNGIRTANVTFPVTNGWEDWRTLTVRVNLLAGTSRIKATATTSNGGPNMDKITVV